MEPNWNLPAPPEDNGDRRDSGKYTDILCPICAAKGEESFLKWIPEDCEYICISCAADGMEGYCSKDEILDDALELLLDSVSRRG